MGRPRIVQAKHPPKTRFGLRSVWIEYLTHDERRRLDEIAELHRQLQAEAVSLREKGKGRARHATATPEQHAAKRARRLQLQAARA